MKRRRTVRAWLGAAAAVACAPLIAHAGNGVFDGSNPAAGNPGDNSTWTDANNWSLNGVFDTLPSDGDDLTFGNNGTVGATIDLLGNRIANSLTFQNANYTLGTSNATTNILTNTTGNVVVNPGLTATINAVLAGANGLSLSGGGTLLLGRTNNTFTGNVLVDGTVAGTALQITGQGNADPASLGAGTNKTVTLTNNGILRIAGASADPSNNSKIFLIGSGGGTFDVASGLTFTLNDGTNTTNLAASNGAQLQSIGGSGDLTKIGAGTLSLGQANGTSFNGANFNGNLLINAGTVLAFGTVAGSTPLGSTAGNTQINNAGVLDLQANTAEAIIINGTNATGSLITSAGSGTPGSVTINTPVAYIGGNGTLNVGSISDNGAGDGVVKVGTGALVFTNTPNYSGTTTIAGGVIRVTSSGNLPSQNIVFAGGAVETSFNINPSLGTGAGQFAFTPGAAGGFSANGAPVIVNVNGDGSTLTWGSATFNPSALILNQTTANNTITLTNGLDLNGSNRTVTVANGIGSNTATIAGQITNSNGTATAGLTKNGAGVLVLTNTGNNYNGTTTINGGILRATDGTTLPISNLIINGGTFETGANFTRAIGTGANQVQFGTNSAGFSANGGPVVVDIGGDGSGTGGQLVWGSATFNPSSLTLNESTANNTLNFRNSINLQSGTSLATRTINVNANTATLSGFITQSSGTAALTKNGSGTLFVTNPTNNFTGTFTFGAGVVNAATLGDYGQPSSLGARLASQETTASNDIIGLHFTGGTLQYTGTTPQSTNRQIRVGTNGATFDASGANTNATVAFTYSGANLNLFDSPGARTFNFTGSNTGTNTFALAINDQSTGTNKTSLNKSGLGRWIFTNPNSNYSGNVSIVSGDLRITNSGAIGSGTVARTISIIPTANPTSLPGLELDGSAGNIALSSNISFTTSYDALNAGVPIANQGAVVNLAGSNTIAGNFTLTSGGGGTTFLVKSGSTLTLSGSMSPNQTGRSLFSRGDGNTVFSGVINNGTATGSALAFTRQSGTGTTTMTAANTYTGATLVSSGLLLVNGTNGTAALAQAAYTVNAADGLGGGTLGGLGTINLANNAAINLLGTASVSRSNNAVLSPGDGLPGRGLAGIGTLTVAGTGTATVNFGSNSTFAVDLGAGNASDKLTLSGAAANLTIAGNTTAPTSNFSDTLALTTANTGTFTVASFGGTRTGVFDFVTLNGVNDPGTFAVNGQLTTFTAADNSLAVNYDDSGKVITVQVNAVPEPTTLVTVLVPAAAWVLGRRRRRRTESTGA